MLSRLVNSDIEKAATRDVAAFFMHVLCKEPLGSEVTGGPENVVVQGVTGQFANGQLFVGHLL